MFGENLRILRKEKGLSQEELASKLNVVRQTVSKWEKGASVPDASLLINISEILETPVSTLLGETVEPSADKNVIAQQLEQINASLSEKNRRSHRIWKIIAIVLILFAIGTILLIIVSIVSFNLFKFDTSTSITTISESLLFDS